MENLRLICEQFGWRTDGDAYVLQQRIEHQIRMLQVNETAYQMQLQGATKEIAKLEEKLRNQLHEDGK